MIRKLKIDWSETRSRQHISWVNSIAKFFCYCGVHYQYLPTVINESILKFTQKIKTHFHIIPNVYTQHLQPSRFSFCFGLWMKFFVVDFIRILLSAEIRVWVRCRAVNVTAKSSFRHSHCSFIYVKICGECHEMMTKILKGIQEASNWRLRYSLWWPVWRE